MFLLLIALWITKGLVAGSCNSVVVISEMLSQDRLTNAQHSFDYNLHAARLLKQYDSLALNNESRAGELLDSTFRLLDSQRITDTILLADLFHRKGKHLESEQEYMEAIAAFDRSIAFKKLQIPLDSVLIAQSYNYKGITYMRLNNYDTALICFNSALGLLRNCEKNRRDIFDVYLNMGIINAILGQYDVAYSHFRQSYLIQKPDSLMTAMFYYNYGLMATTVGKTSEAIDYYNISEKYLKALQGERRNLIGGINLNKGLNAYYNYDFVSTKLFLSLALEIHLENKDFKLGVPKSLYNLGAISIFTGNYNEAIEYSRQGLSYAPDNDLRLLLTINLAKAYNLEGNTQEADHFFRVALGILRQEHVSKTRKPAVYDQYADFLMVNNRGDSALVYLRKALIESEKIYGSGSELNAHLLTQNGYYFLNVANNPDSAFAYFNKAITIWNNTDSLERANLNKTQYAKALVGNALALHALANISGNTDFLMQSEAAFYRVLQQMQRLSQTLSSENKITLAQMLKPVYQQAVDVEYNLYLTTGEERYLQRGFEFSESAKSTALVASVNNQYALKTSDLPQQVFQAENQLTSDIATIQRILADENEKPTPDKRKTNYYKSKLLHLITSYDSLIGRLETDYPKYYQMKYNNSVISSKQIEAQLSQNELFIAYEMSDSVLFRIALGKGVSQFDKIPLEKEGLEALMRLISIKNIQVETENYHSFSQFCSDASYWYQLLLGNLNLETNQKKLTVVPDGLLGYLPFEVLLENNPAIDTINYRDLPYVFLSHPISYTPSGSLKYNSFFNQGSANSSNNLLAFAPSYSDSLPSEMLNSEKIPLQSLPYAKTEALKISKLMHGQAFTDSRATKEAFKKIAGDYGLLHLSMHTLLNDSLPMLSKLVFYDKKNDSTTPFLNIYEIYGLSFKARQVTLSACNTGSGKFKKGEGIMSLARSFLFAGVPSIVMTLWDVQDENGSLLMNDYYKLLKKGMAKDEALQQAKKQILKSANMVKSHPFYWSSYVLSGDTSPIVSKPYIPPWALGFATGLILLLGLIKWTRRKEQPPLTK